MPEDKRRNYTEEEDVVLLRQVLCDRPFLEPRGKISAAWDALAAKLVADDSFPRSKLSGKNAQSRFDKLVKVRQHENSESMASSGVSEDESERGSLLDELIELLNDHNESVSAVKASDAAKRQREEEAAAVARRLAMETLSEDCEASPPTKKKRKEAELKELLVELKEKELADRKEARAEKAREREADRAHMVVMVQAISKSILEMIEATKRG